MKRILLAATLAIAGTQSFAADIGASISIGEPGFYGQIDIGNYPRPVLVYPEPVVIYPAPIVVRQPVYMHVPPGHAKNWGKHCSRYNACGRPVYFVQDSWYNEVYVPQYRHEHGGGKGKHKGHKGKGHKHD